MIFRSVEVCTTRELGFSFYSSFAFYNLVLKNQHCSTSVLRMVCRCPMGVFWGEVVISGWLTSSMECLVNCQKPDDVT